MKEFSSFTHLEKLIFTFEETLKQNGIDIAPDSGLGRVGLAVLDLLQKKNHPHLINRKEDVRAYFADILGVRTFMTKIVALRDHGDFAQLVPHLRKLNEGQVSQNSASGVLDQVSPKLFELLIALGAMQIGSNLELDDPDLSAGGENPDVLVTVDEVRYGLACKALFGASTASLIQNLNKGIDQIEKSPADTGFVIVNVKDLIKHEICWPSPEEVDFPEGSEVDSVAWPDLSFVLSYLEGLATKRVLDMEREIGPPALRDMFRGKKAIPVVVHFLHTATAIAGPSSPVATSVLFLHLYGYGATFIQRMNAALQDQLLPI
jgi:hypothetical protein